MKSSSSFLELHFRFMCVSYSSDYFPIHHTLFRLLKLSSEESIQIKNSSLKGISENHKNFLCKRDTATIDNLNDLVIVDELPKFTHIDLKILYLFHIKDQKRMHAIQCLLCPKGPKSHTGFWMKRIWECSNRNGLSATRERIVGFRCRHFFFEPKFPNRCHFFSLFVRVKSGLYDRIRVTYFGREHIVRGQTFGKSLQVGQALYKPKP